MKKILYTLIAILGFANFASSQEYTVSSGTDKFVLLEVAVGSNLTYSSDAYSIQTSLRNTYPKLIIVNNHNNNFGLYPLKFSTNDQWMSNYIQYLPTGTVDRVANGSMAIQRNNWTNAIIARNITPKYQVSVTVKKIGPQILKVLVIGKALASLTGEYRFNVMITEDSLIQNQASTSGTITNYSHLDVIRAYLGSEWGVFMCNNPTLNQIDTMGFIYTIPNTSNLKNLKIIGMVQKYSADSTLREVMNAVATPLLDTSTSGFNSSSLLINNFFPGNFQYDKIGETFNNQQTNASIYRRLQLIPNNRIGAIWTTSSDGNPYTGRGTGYNRYNGSIWEKGDTSITRIENQRTGYPSYAYNATNNEEVMLSHIVTTTGYAGGMVLSRRTAGTNNTWTQTTVLDTISSVPGVLWCRTAISNNFLHVVACYTDSSGLQPNRVVKSGVRTPVVYSRYNFTNSQWQVINAPLTNYNDIRSYSGTSDSYSIDASGNNVAVLIGGMTKDLSLWKSTNNGTSWTKTVVDSFTYSPYGATQVLMGDTTPTNDGAVHVLLDNIGKAHCFYARARVYDDDTTNTSYNYYPQQTDLLYWNDARTYANKSIIGTWEDIDSNSSYDLANIWPSSDARYGLLNTNTMPSAGISSDGKIFCTYSALTEYDVNSSDENYRDVHITYSSDGGNNWSAPKNITKHLGINREQAFPSIARTVNNKIHLTFTESSSPGPITAGKWDVKYLAIDTSIILRNQSFINSRTSSLSYVIEDTLLCKGKPLNFFLKNAQLWIGSVLVQSTIGTQGFYSIPFDSSKTIIIKDSLGAIIKTINILVVDNIILQRTTLSNTLNICGFATKFGIGATTNYSGSKSFNWFRNDTLLSNNNAIDSFVNAGSYKLRAINFAGCKSELSFTINKFNNVFNPDFASNKQNATTTPFDFTFSNNTTPMSDYNFTWNWGDGNTAQNNNLINFYTYTSNGTYSVKLVAQNKVTGCKDSIVKANYITCSGGTSGVLAMNTNKINPSCYGESNGSITLNTTGGTPPYQFKLNNGIYQTGSAFSNLGAGIYTVYVKDALNNTISKTDTINFQTILNNPSISGSNGVPVSSTQNYNIASQNGIIYTWNIINGTLLSGNGTNSIQVQWAAVSGIGKVIANIARNSCSAADTLVVSIGSNPLTLSTIKTDETCAGKANGAITINAVGGTSPYQYAMNNGTYQTGNTFNNLVAGIYVSKVKDASNVISQKTDTINAGPGITAGAMNGPTAVPLSTLSTYIIGQQTGLTYLWNVTNGIVASGQGTNIAQVSWGATAGTGLVKVKVTSAVGCIDSTQLNVTIGSTNISSASPIVNALKVYPNPASTILHIDLEKPGYYTAKLSSVSGQSIISSTTGTVDISALANGVYILSIYDSNNKLISTNKVAIVK